MSLNSKNNSLLFNFILKNKIFLIITTLTFSSFNLFSQTSSLISSCSDFIAGSATAYPYVLVATTIDSGSVSQASQTYSMNVTSLPSAGANVRVYKTVANGNAFFGNPIPLTLGVNTLTVSAVTFDRSVKFQFSSGDIEFSALTLNGVDSECVVSSPPSTTSQIYNCFDFVAGPPAWPYVLVATTIDSGVVSQGSQTFTMNVVSLPSTGANVRVYKTVANGNDFFGNSVPLSLGLNNITVSAVNFDRAVKFQFSSGDVEFDELSLNGVNTDCITNVTSSQELHYITLNTFPNPSNGDLFIESNDIIEFLEIKDISGKLVLEMFPQKNKVHIQTSQFENSFYFISCIIKNEWITRKIILNHR